MQMRHTAQKALDRIQKKEQKYLEKTAVHSGIMDKISIPEKAQTALTAAFAQGLGWMMEKGDGLIRRGISEAEIRQAFLEQDSQANQRIGRRQLRAIGAKARRVRRCGSGAALAEGIGLGVLGIGLPDIPLFLGVLLRGIYQIALSYGVDVRQEGEQVYLMLLLACAAAPERERQDRLDQIAREIQAGKAAQENLQLTKQEAAESLAQGMLTAKFIQGLPLVGVV